MLFVVYAIDHKDKGAVRQATRAQHLDYVAASGAKVKAGGPFLSDDGQAMQGSMLILEAPDRAAAEAWVAGDPYNKAGLFARVEIRAWRWLVGAPADL